MKICEIEYVHPTKAQASSGKMTLCSITPSMVAVPTEAVPQGHRSSPWSAGQARRGHVAQPQVLPTSMADALAECRETQIASRHSLARDRAEISDVIVLRAPDPKPERHHGSNQTRRGPSPQALIAKSVDSSTEHCSRAWRRSTDRLRTVNAKRRKLKKGSPVHTLMMVGIGSTLGTGIGMLLLRTVFGA